MRHKTIFVSGRFSRFMRRRGWAGLTIPWFGRALVIIWAGSGLDWTVQELRHETAGHVPQIARLGAVRYVATILWQYVRYGHENAPLEIEARKAAGQ